MISVAADLDRVYRLENGTITAYLQIEPERVIDTIAPPPETPTQLACSRTAIFALTLSGTVYTRPSIEGGRWSALVSPPGITWISTDDSYIYALSGGIRQRLLVGGGFGAPDAAPVYTTLVQVDHDESLMYALADDGRVLTRLQSGGWREYPPLGGVVEVVGALDRVYARTEDGDVHRSHVFGRGGWQRLGIDDALAIAIDADHTDTLYVGTATGIRAFGSLGWAGGGVIRAWASESWVSSDWVVVTEEVA